MPHVTDHQETGEELQELAGEQGQRIIRRAELVEATRTALVLLRCIGQDQNLMAVEASEGGSPARPPAETQNPKSEIGCRLLLTGKIYASFPEAIEKATEGRN